MKIAVLDTGIDLNHPDVQACAENIKAKYNCLNEKANSTVHDLDGHGTFVTSLLLDYAPDAEIYVVKVADKKPTSPRVIAKVRHLSADHLDSSLGLKDRPITCARQSVMLWIAGVSIL